VCTVPKYNAATGRVELTEEEKQKLAEMKKQLPFEVPTWNLDDAEAVPQQAWPRHGHIEAQVEGQQVQAIREAPQPEPEDLKPTAKAVWEIDTVKVLRSNKLMIRATETVSGKQVEYQYEPYYDSYRYRPVDIQGATRKLVKILLDKGIEVTETQRVPKPDLMEEMYQLLSIMMSDEVCEKYEQPWSTIKTQFESLL